MKNTVGMKYILWISFIVTAALSPLACKQKSKVYFGAGYAACSSTVLSENKAKEEESQERINISNETNNLSEIEVAALQKKAYKAQQPKGERKADTAYGNLDFQPINGRSEKSHTYQNDRAEHATSHHQKGLLLFFIPLLGMAAVGLSKFFSFKKIKLWAARNPKAGQLALAGLACGTYASGIMMADPLSDLGIMSSQAYTSTLMVGGLSSLIGWRFLQKKKVSPSKKAATRTLFASIILASTFGLSVDLGLKTDVKSLLKPVWERSEVASVDSDAENQMEEVDALDERNERSVLLDILVVLGLIVLSSAMLLLTFAISCNLICADMVYIGLAFLAIGGVLGILIPILIGVRYFRGPRIKKEVEMP
jgi:hypothetical protein